MEKENLINLEGEKIPVKYEEIDILKLKFFPENPRILSIILQNPKIKENDELLEKEMWQKNETKKLYKSIVKHGGLIHPIIVHKDFVLEGNTRLCCYRNLYKTNKDEKWKKIPCQILKVDKLSKDKIDTLLGNEHIIGKQEWDTFEKGCWMSKMLNEDKYNYEKIAEIVGHSIKWVKDHISAYDTMVAEKVIDRSKFSHFVQIFANGEIRKIKNQKDKNVIKEAIKMVKNDQIPTAQDVRKLPILWHDKRSKKRLLEGEKITDTYHLQKARDITLGNTFLSHAKDLVERMSNLTRAEREEISKDNKGKNLIEKLAGESNALLREINKL